jgi:hypothetical protein
VFVIDGTGVVRYAHRAIAGLTYRPASELVEAVKASLVDPLGWTDDASDFRALRVIRMPRAYPLVEADRVNDVVHAPQWLWGLDGMELARGGTVVTAIEAGEAAVARIAAAAR